MLEFSVSQCWKVHKTIITIPFVEVDVSVVVSGEVLDEDTSEVTGEGCGVVLVSSVGGGDEGVLV